VRAKFSRRRRVDLEAVDRASSSPLACFDRRDVVDLRQLAQQVGGMFVAVRLGML